MTKSALLGSTGFVGSTLAKQARFAEYYSTKNIGELSGHYDEIFCAAAPGKKWIANQNPRQDRSSIQNLIKSLTKVTADRFVLISTVDVFRDPNGVDETVHPSLDGLNPYGKNRRELEETVSDIFESPLIVRLPGLVGPGLRKNAIFDLHHGNNPEAIDSRSVFQFYPMVNLWWDISIALAAGITTLHLTAAPTSVEEISLAGFGKVFKNELSGPLQEYDFRSIHAGLFGSETHYQYSKNEVFQAVRSFHQSEPLADEVAPQ